MCGTSSDIFNVTSQILKTIKATVFHFESKKGVKNIVATVLSFYLGKAADVGIYRHKVFW